MMFKRYIITGMSLCALALLMAGAVNWLVDPYGIFGTPPVMGLNTIKPFAGERGRTAKPYQALRMRPRGLIVGNSRPEMGLDPVEGCWPASAHPVYNTALPGLSVYAQVRYAQHAIAVGQVTSMVMAVDFLDFLVAPNTGGDPRQWPVAAKEPRILLADANGDPLGGFAVQQVADYATAAFSLDALIHSGATVWRQGGRWESTRNAAGFNSADGFYTQIIRNEGTGILFAQKNREVVKRLSARRWVLDQGGARWSTAFESISRLLRQAGRKNIRVKLFINPYHAEYLTSIAVAGLWPLFEEWKRRLAIIASEAGDVPFWDFSAFDRHSTEPVAGLSPTGEALTWFWEPAHYRKELGDIMLANLWRPECANSTTVEPFGTRLTGDNISRHLAVQRRAKDAYVKANPDIVRRLQ
jgi:hypothetical protein